MWLFEGIESVSKKKFIVPLVDETEGRSAATLMPLSKKYILPGTIIVSDGWKAHASLRNEGHTHWVVNHSKNFVDPENHNIHTQNTKAVEGHKGVDKATWAEE